MSPKLSKSSNMSSLRSHPCVVVVSPIDTIFTTILGVVYLIWMIINRLEFFPIGVPVSFSTNPGFEPTGTGSPLLDNHVSL